MGLIVGWTERVPVVVPSVLHDDHTRAHRADVALHLRTPLLAGPPRDAELLTSEIESAERSLGVVAEFHAGIAHEDHVGARARSVKPLLVVGRHPQQIGIALE